MKTSIPIGQCQCGCGRKTTIANRNKRGVLKGHPTKYITGHSSRRPCWPAPLGKKWCRQCRKLKLHRYFWGNKQSPDGLQAACKKCNAKNANNWRVRNREKSQLHRLKSLLKRKFSMTVEQYTKMAEDQNWACAVCRQPEKVKCLGTPRILAVDHDHTNNKVRGLLCTRCNTALGLMQENPSTIESLRRYCFERCSLPVR